jgi:hypothetical protein
MLAFSELPMAFLTPDLEAFTKDVKSIFTVLFPQKKVRVFSVVE